MVNFWSTTCELTTQPKNQNIIFIVESATVWINFRNMLKKSKSQKIIY